MKSLSNSNVRRIPRRRRPKHGQETTEAPAQYQLRVITRALDVLECFSDKHPNLSFKEIGSLIALPESSLFRILMTLQARGYLLQNGDGCYQLPPRLLYGKVHERAEQLRERVHPFLQLLAGQFNETASLAYLFGDHIHVIDAVETFQEVRMTNKQGRVLPPHCSSLGKAITAFQPPEMISRILEAYGLAPRTHNTMLDRRAVLADFAHICETGVAFDREESIIGGICIAAAICSGSEPVVAALSVSTPVVRMTHQREQEIATSVLEIARQAAEVLGTS